MPSSAGELRAEALYNLALAYARARQWPQARTAAEDLRRSFPNSGWTPRAFVQLGQVADDAKNTVDSAYFYRAAVNFFPGTAEVAQAQFNLAWAAHDAKDYAQSSRLLTEHLALYADKNTDNRGRAGYWAARDSERAGKLAEARALYQAVLGRYDANWYGYLAKQRLDTMTRNGNASQENYPAESMLGRAIANLQTVTVAEETAGAAEDQRIAKADQLSIIGTDDWAFEELAVASQAAPASPRVNLATARIYRAREDNVQALNVLKRSYPDYSQMKPGRADARRMGRVLSAGLLGHHRAGVAGPQSRSFPGGRTNPAGDDFQSASEICGERVWPDAGAGANRKANRAEVWRRSDDNG